MANWAQQRNIKEQQEGKDTTEIRCERYRLRDGEKSTKSGGSEEVKDWQSGYELYGA